MNDMPSRNGQGVILNYMETSRSGGGGSEGRFSRGLLAAAARHAPARLAALFRPEATGGQIDVPAVRKFEIAGNAPGAALDDKSGALGETVGETIGLAHGCSSLRDGTAAEIPDPNTGSGGEPRRMQIAVG
jgi:hypothetical protein